MNKLKCCLLIDDSKATNFFNKRIIEKTTYVEEVVIAENGKEAIDYLKNGKVPEIIFLDINMPVMNGWEFISKYQELDEKYKGSIIILMLGAELTKKEVDFVERIPEIKEFEQKTLSREIVCKIVNRYFEYATPLICSKKED